VGDGDGDDMGMDDMTGAGVIDCATTAGLELPAAIAGTNAPARTPASRVNEAAAGRKLFGMMDLLCPYLAEPTQPTR
jgi:hypothetical protein